MTHKTRITAMGYIDPSQLLANPKNPRIHPTNQQKAMNAVLTELGWLMPVVLNKRTGHLLDGHMRVSQALSAGAKEIPVVIVDIDPEEESLALATINTIADYAGIDREIAASLLEEAQKITSDPVIQEMLEKLRMRHGLTHQVANPEQACPQESAVPPATISSLYTIHGANSSHIYAIADAADPSIYDAIAAIAVPSLLVTDPPYGVDYVKTKSGMQNTGFATIEQRHHEVHNDSGADIRQLVTAALANVLRITPPRMPLPVYVWSPPLEMQIEIITAMRDAGLLVHRQIIWKKRHFVITRSGQWHWSHEVCWYGWRPGAVPQWNFEKNKTTIWEMDQPRDRAHPTQKPIDAYTIPLMAHTRPGDAIIDPFAGSGTAIRAAESLSRRAICIEIDANAASKALEALRDAFTVEEGIHV